MIGLVLPTSGLLVHQGALAQCIPVPTPSSPALCSHVVLCRVPGGALSNSRTDCCHGAPSPPSPLLVTVATTRIFLQLLDCLIKSAFLWPAGPVKESSVGFTPNVLLGTWHSAWHRADPSVVPGNEPKNASLTGQGSGAPGRLSWVSVRLLILAQVGVSRFERQSPALQD